jgi:hypothetical protein
MTTVDRKQFNNLAAEDKERYVSKMKKQRANRSPFSN